MSEIPAALQAALEQQQSKLGQTRRPVELWSARVTRGDLRVIRPLAHEPSEPRVGLVLSVDSHHDFAEVLLVHTAPEMACEVDGVVPRSLSLAPYDVVVETDLRGVVWTLQITEAVGRVEEEVLAALGRIISGGEGTADGRSVDTAVYAGPRLAGPSDPRWAFKGEEGDSLRHLTRDCTDALLEAGMEWLVDPGLLRPELLDRADDRQALIAELLHWVETRAVTVASADLELLVELGVIDLEAWRGLGDLGVDIWTGLQELIQRAATSNARARSGPDAAWHLVAAMHLDVSTQVREIEIVHYLGRKEALPA